LSTEIDRVRLRRWRKRGFYSETVLVKLLQKKGYNPADNEHKHAVVAAHLGKRWLFKEVSWSDWEKNKLPEKVRILKRDRGNLNLDTTYT
jgi:hypothetical protein